MEVHCDNRRCIYHSSEDGLCHSECVYYHNRLCDTYSHRGETAGLMQPDFKARCHKKGGGKYKSDHVKHIR